MTTLPQVSGSVIVPTRGFHDWENARGFTLIEMLVTIMIFAVLMAIAIPSFRNASLGSNLNSVANNLIASVQLARSEAIKRNVQITLCASTNGSSCVPGSVTAWETGWVVLDGTNVIQAQEKAPIDYKVIQTGPGDLVFQPIGVGATAATFKVCRSNPVGNQERKVTITATGVAYVERTTDGSCP